ncbi:MAG TPA: hypothetical protein DHV62_04315 [Elusimicrobia bacterium]|jgi:hypothetical protein|nr:hypothetical protein [Elusimicrobiota bacterium]
MSEPFYFYTQSRLVKLLGIKARNPLELLEGLKKVPLSSIYYHTHRFLQQHHYLSPEPPNDFAYWLRNILNLDELGEAIASVNIISFRNMEELRKEFIKILDGYISKGKPAVYCPEGQEFHFMSCATFVLPKNYIAHNLKEFVEILNKVSINSLYFHIFEAKMRLEKEENDFTAWFKGIGEEKLAEELSRLDPYTITLEGLRQRIIRTVRKYARD